MSYQAPINDLKFALKVHAHLNELLNNEKFEALDQETANAILEEAAKFAGNIWSESNRLGDINGVKFKDGTTEHHESIRRSFEAFRDAGWNSLRVPVEYGGQGIPTPLSAACEEMWYAGNLALSLLPMLTNGAIEAINRHASQTLKDKFLPKLCQFIWSATMNLTEPSAGSDLGQITTKALPLSDGTYEIVGQKIFITWGEHDFTENIIHLVLARLPDAPAGTKGISLFLVPKFWVNDDESLGERNTVELVSVEHKMGIHASPTCVLKFNHAKGYLIGEAHHGLSYMFTMMNHARLGVGIEGHAIAEAAFQHAKNYANERVQGHDVTSSNRTPVTIIHHPDIRRMLLIQKATLEAQRALYLETAFNLDVSEHHPDETQRQRALKLVDFMIPIVKAFLTENSVVLTNLAMQVFGGMGYIEETGVAQYVRDARITPIYEGTTGIQAIDSIGRKTAKNNGLIAQEILKNAEKLVKDLSKVKAEKLASLLSKAIELAQDSVDYVVANYNSEQLANTLAGAVPYLMQMSTTLGAVVMAKSYLAAVEALQYQKTDDLPESFYQNKIRTVEVYFDHILPNIHSYHQQVNSGTSIMSVPIEAISGPAVYFK